MHVSSGLHTTPQNISQEYSTSILLPVKKVAGINMILCLMAREGDATRVRSEADDLGVCAKGELPGQARETSSGEQ